MIMKKVILNGKYMKNKKLAHLYIKFQLDSNEYIENNLDALWDVLTSYSQPLKIALVNKDILIENLGDYGESIIQVFKDAEVENENIEFEIIECSL